MKGDAWTTVHGAQTDTHGRAGESPQGLTRSPQHDGGVGVYSETHHKCDFSSTCAREAACARRRGPGKEWTWSRPPPAALYWTRQHVTSATVRARPPITVRVHVQYIGKVRAAVSQKGNGSKLKVNIGFN